MKLDEFVKQTLLDITNGVVAAQQASKLWIAPGYMNGNITEEAQDAKFEVSVTVAADGGGGIKILSFGELNAGGKSESTNKLMFEVPICLNEPTQLNLMH